MSYKNLPYDFSLGLAENICNNRGVAMQTILSPRLESVESPLNLDNMEEGVKLFLKHIYGEGRIFLQQDSDVDGLCSAAILYNYIQEVFPEEVHRIDVGIHPGKEHGLFPNLLLDGGYVFAIAPDASSNQYEEHAQLKQMGIDVLVLDHHEAEKYSEDAVVINNQLSPFYTNKAMSGAGIVWQFCRALDKRLRKQMANKYLDLVAVALMGDMMDVREEETRFLIDRGLQGSDNYLIKALFGKIVSNPFSEGPISGKDVSFTVAPLINATIRVGSQELKRKLFDAITFIGDSKMVKTTKRGGFGQEELSAQVIREMESCKRRQKTEVDRMVSRIDETFGATYKNDTVIVVPLKWEDVNPNLIGLVANIISNREQQPCVILRFREDNSRLKWTGSVRAYGVEEFKDMVSVLPSVGFAEGHQQACGIGILPEDIEVFKSELREKFSGVKPEIVYNVDASIDLKRPHINWDELKTVAELTHKKGTGFPEPLIELANFTPTENSCLLVGQRRSTISFRLGFCFGVKLFTKEEVYQDMLSNKFGTLNLYGYPTLKDDGTYGFTVIDYKHNEPDFSQFVF